MWSGVVLCDVVWCFVGGGGGGVGVVCGRRGRCCVGVEEVVDSEGKGRMRLAGGKTASCTHTHTATAARWVCPSP